MKTESHAWMRLEEHAAAQLRMGFADRVVRAAREADVPSLLSQFALGTVTAAVCLAAVVTFHSHTLRVAEEQNLAGWEQIVSAAEDFDLHL